MLAHKNKAESSCFQFVILDTASHILFEVCSCNSGVVEGSLDAFRVRKFCPSLFQVLLAAEAKGEQLSVLTRT